jgi:DMSO reductase family type II enzyme chaperone
VVTREISSTELAVARSNLYKLLSIGYSRPSQDLYRFISSGEFEKALRKSILDIPWEPWQRQALGLLETDFALPPGSFQDYESLYISIFDVGVPKAPCPLGEGFYRIGSHRGEVILEVLTFYKAFALAISDAFKDLHDHIVAELEFLHFLTFKEQQAARERSDSDPYLRAQQDFIDRHLGTMFPGMRISAERVLKGGFFLTLIRLTELFVAWDRDYIKGMLNEKGDKPA